MTKPTEIQEALRALLEADETLAAAGCGVSRADDPDFAARIEEALGAGGSGVHATVGLPSFTPESTASKTPVGKIRLLVGITETPAVRCERPEGVPAADLAWHVARAVNMAALAGTTLVLDGKIEPAVSADGGTVAFSVAFTGEHAIEDF